ncbi:hypothetical protein LTR62_006564 [Meristemomyces frigidus]|uniref:Rhodopsin domain-containing protein n=1 Tax=Meristemomyces frigidus TaxID=1508187 RepID=A0AAN7TBU2_9PEZI|nr:hypothetical protein LTR62_006564 [Meristemomyces frigidus]
MASTLPPGYTAPPFKITPTDHSGLAVIAASIAFLFILLFAAIRLWMRYPYRHRSAFSSDDIVLLVATALGTIQCIQIITAAHAGFGKTQALLTDQQTETIDKILYAGGIVYVTALLLSKTSMVLLALRLSPENYHVYACQSTLAFCVLVTVAAIPMVAVGCSDKQPWVQGTRACGSLYSRWLAIEISGCVIELAVFVLVSRVFLTVQRKWHGKLKGLVVFGLRLPVLIFSTYRLLALRQTLLQSTSQNQSPNPPLPSHVTEVNIILYTEIELAWSLVMATVPCLMPFMMKLNTGLGGFVPDNILAQTQHDSAGSGLRSNGGGGGGGARGGRDSYVMQSTKGKGSQLLRSRDDEVRDELPPPVFTLFLHQARPQMQLHMRPDMAITRSCIVSPAADARSLSSDDSTGMIIKRTVEVSYSSTA